MKKIIALIALLLSTNAISSQTMRICQPEKATPAPAMAEGLRSLNKSTVDYLSLCKQKGFKCHPAQRNNFDDPGSTCFVLTAINGKIPKPEEEKPQNVPDNYPKLVPAN